MKVRISTVDFDCLVPNDRLDAELGCPVEFYKGRHALGIDEPESVNAKALHHTHRTRDRAIGHLPHHHVHRLRRTRDPVPEGVMRRLCLWEAAVGLLFHRVSKVGKLDGILDEENRDVVANDVPVAFGRVHLDRKAAHVAG